MSAFEEVAIVKGPTVMTSSSACATADVAKSMTKETADDLRMATPLRKLHDRRCQNRSNHAVCKRLKLVCERLKLCDVLKIGSTIP